MKIDHIGIAVRSLEKSVFFWENLLDTTPRIEKVEAEGVRVAIFKLESGRIEFLEPISEETPVGKFIRRHGEGVHHIALAVDDVNGFKKKNPSYSYLYPEARNGSESILMNFLHPGTTGGGFSSKS